MCLRGSHTAGRIPGDTAANSVKRAGLYTDSNPIPHADTNANANLDCHRDAYADIQSDHHTNGHTDTHFDTNHHTHHATVNIDTRQQ